MDRSKLYECVRAHTSGVFGTSLSRSQVAGMEVILDAVQRAGLPLKQHAYVLATAYHETGGKMQPVNENLNYTSAARIREVWPKRFSSTAAAISYVRNPQGLANRVYADRMGNGPEASGDGWRYRGRALPQITGEDNYRKASKLVGVDLIADPDAANDDDISAHILVEGMRTGMFTGRKLSDFISGDRADYVAARAIINDDVKANGQKIADYAVAFERALSAGNYDIQDKPAGKTPVLSIGDRGPELVIPKSPGGGSPPQTITPQPGPKPGFFASLISRLFRKGA